MTRIIQKHWRLCVSLSLIVAVVQLQYYNPAPSSNPQENKANDVVTSTTKKKCTGPREGVIIVNTLGLMANGLFEVAYANRLASELCWDVLYRPAWNTEFPSQRGFECFPNSGLPENYKDFSPNLSPSLQEKIGLNASQWQAMTTEWSPEEIEMGDNDDEFRLSLESYNYYFPWVDAHVEAGLAKRLLHTRFQVTGNRTEKMVNAIRKETSEIRILSLEAYFIHHDWMVPWMPEIRQWFTMNEPLCCRNHPPENAVVVHVRDFDDPRDGSGIEASVYTEILIQYNLTDRPLWIVCQPKSVNSEYVKSIIRDTPRTTSTTIVTGTDQYDAFCTLTRAKTLLLSAASTFSQMGAILADPEVEVHFPIPFLEEPRVTLKVPTWKYHLVADSRETIAHFDVPHHELHVDTS